MERVTPPGDFAAWLREQLTRAGYDLSLRGGGQTRFAEASGISRATISRMLAGQGATDTRTLTLLSDALRVPLPTVLVRAGVLTEDELKGVHTPTSGPRRITPEQAADELGISDPQARDLFISMTETLRRSRSTHEQGGRAVEQ